MKPYARVIDGLVIEITAIPDDINLTDIFVPEVASEFVVASPDVTAGWLYLGEEFKAPEPPTPVKDPPYTIYKTTIWLRLSDEEAETVMDAKSQQPAKFRGLWDDALSIESNSPFFDTLKLFLTAALSKQRANDLLQPE